ncbi:hypothetical protein [Youngiibacter multivorans]|jgi:Ni/Fe-hydrogenase subunit HybB-like protein|uniref:Ni/Fe-hydrogenase subunit HybB-like protein n=1 Tax=Youngiibacter multivorans TaxID=937251 RepID=A0ABS4FZH5_9CLOT|nr:hypothetical protein [Youngiibacter multivorans]MBP1917657.1 Ni/Fe-hydrogenase subunit HybB-like protein [Youngiibacter multivorans]
MDDTTRQTDTRNTKLVSHLGENIIGIIYGLIEILLAFRLGFKLLGVNPENEFVSGVYKVTQYIVGIFEGGFSRVITNGIDTTAIFEPATPISMLVVALIVWGLMKLIKPRYVNRYEKAEQSDHEYREN